MNLGDLQRIQYGYRYDFSCALHWNFLYPASVTQPDLSGNGNFGTVTGAVNGDHVLLGPPFGYDLRPFSSIAAPIVRRRVSPIFFP